jgi:hypothetical protein
MMTPRDGGVFGLNGAAAFWAQSLVNEDPASIHQRSKSYRLFWETLRRFAIWSGKKENEGGLPAAQHAAGADR